MSQKNGSTRPTREAIQDDLALLRAILKRGKAIDKQSKALVSADTAPTPPRITSVLVHEAIPSKTPARDTWPPFPGFNVRDKQGDPVYTQRPAGPMPWDALEDSWFGHGLRQCVAERRHGVAQALLQILFGKLCAGMADPTALNAFEAQVFKGFPKTGTGRRVKEERGVIVKTWEDLGRPSVWEDTLAKKVYGDATWASISAAERKNRRNKCSQAVKRADEAKQKTPHIDIEIFP